MGGAAVPLIGAGLGLAGSLFGPKERTTTAGPDPQTQAFLNQFRGRAGQVFNRLQGDPGLSQFINPALQMGFGTGLGGVEEFFNPFQESVVGGIQAQAERQRELARRRAAGVATRAGAFGGDRSAILEAELTRPINEAEQRNIANLQFGGFQNAVQQLMAERARQAGLGFGAMGFLDQRLLNALQAMGLGVPGGGQQITEPFFRNPFAGALGGAIAGAGIPGLLQQR